MPAGPSQDTCPVAPPPPPWRLRGRAILLLQQLRIEDARAYVPAALDIAPIAPGKTLGILYLASYETGSTLCYHELIVVPALVRHGLKFGGWISHIYVDEPRSVAGGQQYWALPKELAAFQWSEEGRSRTVLVRQGEDVLCRLQASRTMGRVKLPVLAPAFSLRNGDLLWFQGRGWGRCSIGSAEVELVPASPFAALGFNHGRQLYLDRFDVLMPAP